MKVLITGGCGFVGATLARTLLARGHLAGRSLATLVLADQVHAPADLQNGFVSLQLELARHGETASLVFGAHVLNTP